MRKTVQILYLDDEVNNLMSFRASLNRTYKIFTANSVSEARQILTEHPDIHIIFSDQRMPDMLGTAFFEELKTTYPKIVRILITGYSDLNTTIDAINKGNVFRYVNKPWLIEEVQQVIEEAIEQFLHQNLEKSRNQELESAYSALENYTDHISHDIRGPLTGIRSISEIAENLDDKTEIASILSIIKTTSQQLDQYTSNLQHFYRIRRGNINTETIDIQQLCNELAEMYQASFITANIHFRIENEISTPIKSDKAALQLILHNLLANAIKYQKVTGDKSVSVHFTSDKDMLIISIQDTGIGIEPAHLLHIFDRFYQADPMSEGHGVGLYHAQQMAKKLGGLILVSSKPNEGSTFTLSIQNQL